jgi:uncharacterized membrane protein (UPF0182 family)
MYVLLFLAGVALGAWLISSGLARRSVSRIVPGMVIVLGTLSLFALLDFWGDMLWFETLGYAKRFWTFIGYQATAVTAGFMIAGALAYLIAWPTRSAVVRWGSALAGALGGAVWGLLSWQNLLMFIHRVSTGQTEPILGADTGFYLFALPFFDELYNLLFFVAIIGIIANAAVFFDWNIQSTLRLRRQIDNGKSLLPLLSAVFVFAIVLAWGRILGAYHLLYSQWGVVAGPGWTDVKVRLPAYYVITIVLLIFGAAPLFAWFRNFIARRFLTFLPIRSAALGALAAAWTSIVMIWIAALGILPALVQWLMVEPNEITYEAPYIANNIKFTRQGFHLDKVEEKQFPASEKLSRATIDQNSHLLSEVRLWDWRALDAVYKQFQEIRLYYEFVDVDIDRYTFGDRYRQVMVSARELAQFNLPLQSQTFVNQRFKYTHGYGLTMATVSDFTPEGLPNLLIKDLPPKAQFPELQVTRPEIYYGELTREPVVVNSEEEEFDYPSGENNVYIRYPGKGGVQISNLWRKFLYGWKFDGTRFLLSSYPNSQSRVMFYRQVRERVAKIAPFLELDQDPYIVLDEGRLYWIVDAYTTSEYFPYSEPFSSQEFIEYKGLAGVTSFRQRTAGHLSGANYIRNSVKVVVDAFNGDVDFYVFEPDDPLIQMWRNALPGVFKGRDDMPPGLQAHVRYPQDFLLAQGLVYAKYHMTTPEVFYNQEDLWVRATEKHYNRIEPVEPYYVMWELPGSDKAEFVLIQPFTPKNRQVLIGWIAGLSDGKNYGRFLAYKFPKEKRILGPQQVETKIDQDSFLSGQLTLWDQRGSHVIRGNVLAIPLNHTLLYVEPIYLQAETAAYPELRLVVVMHGDNMSYAESFDQALQGLFENRAPEVAAKVPLAEIGKQANEAFKAYLKALGEQKFQEASQHLQRLSELLSRLAKQDEMQRDQ